MITSKSDLYEYLNTDNNWLLPQNKKEKIIEKYANYPSYTLKKYLYYLRKQEYYINTANKNKVKGMQRREKPQEREYLPLWK